jgi:hypothetical protein
MYTHKLNHQNDRRGNEARASSEQVSYMKRKERDAWRQERRGKRKSVLIDGVNTILPCILKGLQGSNTLACKIERHHTIFLSWQASTIYNNEIMASISKGGTTSSNDVIRRCRHALRKNGVHSSGLTDNRQKMRSKMWLIQFKPTCMSALVSALEKSPRVVEQVASVRHFLHRQKTAAI